MSRRKRQRSAAETIPMAGQFLYTSDRRSFLQRELLPCAALVILAFAAYWPALHGEFVFDDDTLYVLQNPCVQADDGLYRIWCTTQPIDFYPLTHTVFWLEWRLWGMNTLGYHVLNVSLHAATSIIIWFLLRQLGVGWAWLAAAIFVLHPVNVQAVAWISQLKSLIASAFGFAALLCYCRFDVGRRRSWYYAAIAFCTMAHLGKSSMLLIPVLLTGYILWQRRRLNRRDLYDLAPFYLLTLLFGLVGCWFMHQSLHYAVRDDNFIGRLITASWAIWFYWYQLFAPINLALIYPKWHADVWSLLEYLPGLILLGAAGLFFRYRRSWGLPFLVGLGFFVITILPALGFFDVGMFEFCLVADHYQYQSMIGIVAILVGATAWVTQRHGLSVRRSVMAAFGVLLAVLFGLTWQQAGTWTDSETLWRYTIAKTPTAWIAYETLAQKYLKEDRLDDALECAQQAVFLEPVRGSLHITAGLCYKRKDDAQQAEREFRKAIELSPDEAGPYVNLGNILRKSQPNEAAELYCKAIERDPWCAEAHNNLGGVWELTRPEEAWQQYRRALEIDPKFADAHNNLGAFLARRGRFDEAASHFCEALRLKPNFPEASRNLDRLMSLLGRNTGKG